MTDTRYPYTYACDYIRGLAGYGPGGTKLSRAEASEIYTGIAVALGMDSTELARKLADHYKANEEGIAARGAARFAAASREPLKYMSDE